MASRELLVVILNHTNEELNTEPQWPTLIHGQFIKDDDLPPPQTILAGESGMLRCKSNHLGGGVEGSITYRVVGFGTKKRSDIFLERAVQTLGGHGNQAVVVFVFVR
uniref:Uncharacterized protein n=1 Tax=Fusarium oxysporum (strain Fo5176) TaxID=660025 RepID=A0A0D2XLA5_FUSOF